MLDDLKRERHAANPGRDLFKLALYVVGLLIFGIVIFAGSRCGSTPREDAGGEPAPRAATPESGPVLDRTELARLVRDSGDEPYHYAPAGIEYVRRMRRTGSVGAVSARLNPDALALRSLDDARGLVFEIEGRVTELTREVYSPGDDAAGDDRLWSVVLEGPDGSQAVALKYALASEPDEGRPREAKPPRVRAAALEPGQYVAVRGVYVQRRTGTLGATTLARAAPVLLASDFRILLPPEDRDEVISGLDEALWGDVQDRYSRGSRRWDEDAVFEVVKWARARGYEACRDDLLSGELPWKTWGLKTFEIWKKEVSVKRDTPRPFTEGARGHVFRTPGMVGEVLAFGWERIPPNRWNVDRFQLLRMLSDYYQHIALEAVLAFPIDTFPGVRGRREEHLNIYGVFVKNKTYDTIYKRDDGTDRALPVTAPMFVVLHVEPFPENAAVKSMRRWMWWIAGSMVLFAVLFYVVLIRGGARQVEAMEAHRLALRQRIRAKGQGAKMPRSRGAGPDRSQPDSPTDTQAKEP